MVDARTPQIKHLSVRCKYEVALPTAVDDSGVQPQLLVAVRNVRASRQWWTTGLLNVDTRPRTSSLRSRGCREIHAHSPRDDPALVYEYTRRSVLRNDRGRRQRASSSRDEKVPITCSQMAWRGVPGGAVRLDPARLATTRRCQGSTIADWTKRHPRRLRGSSRTRHHGQPDRRFDVSGRP